MFRSFLIMLLFFISSTFALTGEFVTLSTEAKNCNKVELMGASATVSIGAASMSGSCKVQEEYITITTVDKNDNREVYSFQIAKNGKELIGKNQNDGIVYVKYSDENATPDSKLAFGKIAPPKPIAIETYNAGNIIKIGITEKYIKFAEKNYKDRSPDTRIMSNAMATASKMVREYRMKGIVFSAYTLDAYKDSIDGCVFRMYVNDKIVYQQIKLAKSEEERWNLMAHYSNLYGGITFRELGHNVMENNSFFLFYPFWVKKNDSYMYSKMLSRFPFVDSMSAEIEKSSSYQKSKKAFDAVVGLFPIEFVVCDNDWNPVCWFDIVKNKVAGEAIVNDNINAKDYKDMFSQAIENLNKSDSSKTETK